MKIILSFLALASSVFAAETRNIEVSFYCLKYVPGVETIHIPRDAGSEAIRLSTANLTNPVLTTLVDNQASFRKTPINGQVTESAGTIRVPENIHKALVVLIPNGPKAVEPYQTLVIDRGENFKLGTYRVINFSRKSIRGAIGKSFVETHAGKISDLELQGEPGTVQGVRFEFEKEGRWNRLTETRCAVRKDRRWLLCIYQDPVTERINMRSIPDRSNLLTSAPLGDAADGDASANAN
jgi:hypothetical protein